MSNLQNQPKYHIYSYKHPGGNAFFKTGGGGGGGGGGAIINYKKATLESSVNER